MATRSRQRQGTPDETVTHVQDCLLRRADELQDEAAGSSVGTFKYLIASRISLEFRKLAAELNYH